ncbi:AAA family ATPase [Spirosoma jeollabukense]
MATENPRVWFKSISLENVRSFGTKQTINFTDKDGNAARWNVILGDNGTGKTTVLKGLVYSYLSVLEIFDGRNEFLDSLERSKKSDLHIWSEYAIGNDVTFKHHFIRVRNFKSAAEIMREKDYEIGVEHQPIKQLKVFGYGASRRIGSGSITQPEFSSETDIISNSITTLFRDDKSLQNAEEWLVQADYISLREEKFSNQYSEVLRLLKTLFQSEVSDIYIDTKSGVPKVFFKTHYGDVRLHELSLGYKTLIAWMVDFAKGLFDRYPDSENPLAEPAVCLVDEIDLHLHPKFQRTIIQFLTDTFPNTQFIVTAHSPLIVQSAEDANIILLKREGDETHVADGIDVHSWRIDQILSSDLFGGVSGRPAKTEERMQRRRALLLKDDRTDAESQELEKLEEELGMLTASESKEALKALELIGKALSK